MHESLSPASHTSRPGSKSQSRTLEITPSSRPSSPSHCAKSPSCTARRSAGEKARLTCGVPSSSRGATCLIETTALRREKYECPESIDCELNTDPSHSLG